MNKLAAGIVAAIAIGFFSAQHFGAKPGIILGGAMFGSGAAMGLSEVLNHKSKTKTQNTP